MWEGLKDQYILHSNAFIKNICNNIFIITMILKITLKKDLPGKTEAFAICDQVHLQFLSQYHRAKIPKPLTMGWSL